MNMYEYIIQTANYHFHGELKDFIFLSLVLCELAVNKSCTRDTE